MISCSALQKAREAFKLKGSFFSAHIISCRSAIVEILVFGAVILFCGHTGKGTKMCHNKDSSPANDIQPDDRLKEVCFPVKHRHDRPRGQSVPMETKRCCESQGQEDISGKR